MKGDRMSAKQKIVKVSRIRLKDGTQLTASGPSFLMPYMTAAAHRRTSKDPCLLRKFGVPALGLGPRLRRRSDVLVSSWNARWAGCSVVGTTVRTGGRCPQHLLADEHHQSLDGQKALHRHDHRQRVHAWERSRPRRQGATS